MTLGPPIQLRLQQEKQFFYQEEAARQGLPLVSYLRERLAKADKTIEAIASLRHEVTTLRLMLEDIAAAQSNKTGNSDNVNPNLLEILMLLRQLCRPEQLKIAQGELVRLGLSTRQW